MASEGGLVPCSRAAHSKRPACEEGPAKKTKTEETTVPAAAGMQKQRKTKTMLRRVPDDHVKFVLAAKPTPLYRRRPELEPTNIPAEQRRSSARVQELIKANRELVRSTQEHYARELATKGYVEVEVEVEVSDDESEAHA